MSDALIMQIEVGQTAQLMFVDQSREALDNDDRQELAIISVLQVISSNHYVPYSAPHSPCNANIPRTLNEEAAVAFNSCIFGYCFK